MFDYSEYFQMYPCPQFLADVSDLLTSLFIDQYSYQSEVIGQYNENHEKLIIILKMIFAISAVLKVSNTFFFNILINKNNISIIT